MLHEHTRPDRDDSLWYQCENVEGSQAALEQAMKDGHSKADAERGLCEDHQFALRYAFAGSEFVKGRCYRRPK
jgi:hypothetical protein